jgi:ribose transport system permease protein
MDDSRAEAARTVDLGAFGRKAGPRIRSAAILIPFVALFVVLSLTSEPFFTKDNLRNILDQQSKYLIVAGAGTLVLVAGGIDLSVGAVFLLGGVAAAKVVLAAGPVAGVLVGVGVGLAIGLANGILVTIFRINALIATLAMSFVIVGLTGLITKGLLINLLPLGPGEPGAPSFGKFATSHFLGITSQIWVMVIVVVALGLVLARTRAGRYMYAAGGNPAAARLAGVRVDLIRTATFVLSGGAAALAGVLVVSQVLVAGQSSGGPDFTFTVLAGMIVGGTSILGGEGAVWRSVVGVLFIALVGNGFDLLGYDPLYKQIVQGGLILVAVGIDAWTRTWRR